MRILIGGDVSIKSDCEALFADGNKGRELFGDIVDLFECADRVMVNLECAVTEKETPIKKIGPNLKAPLNTVKTLKSIFVTDCLLSNNHIFDYGSAGIKDTLLQLEKYGINYTGFGKNEVDARKNMVIEKDGVKISVIAVCEHEYSYALQNRMGARGYDPYDTNEDIENAKKESDYVIVIYHGGKEGCRYPSPRLLKACRSMVKHGADVVLCQHSHCIGCYEKYMNGHILYGQGNFHFVSENYAQDDEYAWNTGFLVEVLIENGLDVKFIPCKVQGKGIDLAKGTEKAKLLNDFEERNKSLQDGTWYEKWRAFALSQERYLIVPKELKEELAHFFDCEAHTDACKEIYKTYNETNELEDE